MAFSFCMPLLRIKTHCSILCLWQLHAENFGQVSESGLFWNPIRCRHPDEFLFIRPEVSLLPVLTSRRMPHVGGTKKKSCPVV